LIGVQERDRRDEMPQVGEQVFGSGVRISNEVVVRRGRGERVRAGLRCRAKGAKEMGEGGAGKIVGCGYLSRPERRQGEAKVRAPAEGVSLWRS
jgi:hypothetical protein